MRKKRAMNNKNDFVHEINKPDYYTIIKRRRRSIENILEEHGVITIKELRQLKKSLGGAYSISQEFMDDATAAIHKMPLSEEIRTSLKKEKADIETNQIIPSDIDKPLEKPIKKKKTRKKKKKKPSATKKDE
jgi:hypothetical protein